MIVKAKVENLMNWFLMIANDPNSQLQPFHQKSIIDTKNSLSLLSFDLQKEYSHHSSELFRLKDSLFYSNGVINLFILGEVIAILRIVNAEMTKQTVGFWNLIHPKILAVSKQLFIEGHNSEAVEDAFKEINSRTKAIFKQKRPSEQVPDGQQLMTTVFSEKNPIVQFCEMDSESGRNTQRGFMLMFAGSIAALRNPKAHENIDISSEDAMRQLSFASMLMYKLDEGVRFSGIQEK